MSDFATLKTDVATYMGRSDLTAIIPTLVKHCESRIRALVRVAQMETTDNAFAIAAQTVAVPTGFIGVRRIIIDSTSGRALNYLPPERFWGAKISTESGNPEAYTIEGTNFVFAPAPTTSINAKLLYIKAFDALSADSDTNWLLTNHYDVYLYGTLAEAKGFIEDDEQGDKWLRQFNEAVERVNHTANRGRRGAVLKRFGNTPP